MDEFTLFEELPLDIQRDILFETNSYGISKRHYEDEEVVNYRRRLCTRPITRSEIMKAINEEDQVNILLMSKFSNGDITATYIETFIEIPQDIIYKTSDEISYAKRGNVHMYLKYKQSDGILRSSPLRPIITNIEANYDNITISTQSEGDTHFRYGNIFLLPSSMIHILLKRGSLCRSHINSLVRNIIQDTYNILFKFNIILCTEWLLACLQDLSLLEDVYDTRGQEYINIHKDEIDEGELTSKLYDLLLSNI